jgi:hypothetical protein
MPEIPISDADLNSFYATLQDGQLSSDQVKLLDAILQIVRDVTAKDEALKHEFDGSFKQDEAELILSYGNGDFVIGPRMVGSSLVRLRLIK